jgi:hypothetical protein
VDEQLDSSGVRWPTTLVVYGLPGRRFVPDRYKRLQRVLCQLTPVAPDPPIQGLDCGLVMSNTKISTAMAKIDQNDMTHYRQPMAEIIR